MSLPRHFDVAGCFGPALNPKPDPDERVELWSRFALGYRFSRTWALALRLDQRFESDFSRLDNLAVLPSPVLRVHADQYRLGVNAFFGGLVPIHWEAGVELGYRLTGRLFLGGQGGLSILFRPTGGSPVLCVECGGRYRIGPESPLTFAFALIGLRQEFGDVVD